MNTPIQTRMAPRVIDLGLASAGMALLLGVALAVAPAAVWADDPKAREIMEKVNDRDDGDNRTSDVRLVLIDKNGDGQTDTWTEINSTGLYDGFEDTNFDGTIDTIRRGVSIRKFDYFGD